MTTKTNFPVIVVTGLSGSGKSTALRVFEDLGYFCVDGMPVSMLPKLAEMFQEKDPKHRGLVLGMDLRQDDFLQEWEQANAELRSVGLQIQVLFLECRLKTLVTRYATTRRPHPLESTELGLEQALEKEKELLEPIRDVSALVLDTTDYSIHDLRRIIQEKWYDLEVQGRGMRVHIVTFGFKYGVPLEADLVFDLRFLPNPYFDESLRELSGKDKPVADYVLGTEPGITFKKKFLDFLIYLLPQYAQEGRYRMTVAIGCTGGRHRSVSVAEEVYKTLKNDGYSVAIEHRHLELG